MARRAVGLAPLRSTDGTVQLYGDKPDDPESLSDNRVNALHFDQQGTLWAGTQDGLSKFNRQTGTFKNYYEKDGLAGDVVSCIEEDRNGVFWMERIRASQNRSACAAIP